jgi:hypothetical protein
MYSSRAKVWQNLYQNYIRELLSIGQTSDVLEYSTRFEKAKHKVNRNLDEVFLVQKFLDGLKYFVSSAITYTNQEQLMPPCLWLLCRRSY